MSKPDKTKRPPGFVVNGVVDSCSILIERGFALTVYMNLMFDENSGQGFSSPVLGGVGDARCANHAEQANLMAEWVGGIMEVCEVKSFDKCKGSPVRVVRDSEDEFASKIIAIGHFYKEIWFHGKERTEALVKGVADVN